MQLLTPRERQVLEGLVNGFTNKQIAQQLGLSARTVETHRAHIMDKTGSNTFADLVRKVVSGLPHEVA
jgi:two-component system response regulator FixJ